MKSLKERIRQHIELAERTFHPEETVRAGGSSAYLRLLSAFQQRTLDFCALWRSVENEEPFSRYVDKATPDFAQAVCGELDRISQADMAAIRIFESVRDLLALEALTAGSHLTPINRAQQDGIVEATKTKHEADAACLAECERLLNMACSDRENNRNYIPHLNKAMKHLRKLKNEAVHYRRDEMLLDFAIACNNLFTVSSQFYEAHA